MGFEWRSGRACDPEIANGQSRETRESQRRRERKEWDGRSDKTWRTLHFSLPLLPWRWRQQIAHQQIPEDSRPNVCYLTTSFPHETLQTTERWNISQARCRKKAVIWNNLVNSTSATSSVTVHKPQDNQQLWITSDTHFHRYDYLLLDFR
jgi:hypothetical protein